MVDADEARQAALESAYAAIASAEATLAEPRHSGPIWASATAQPVQEQRTEMPVRKTVSRTAPATVPRLPVEDIRMLMGVVGKEVGTVVKALAGRVDDLEQRLASVEALLAEARGSSQ